MSQYDSTQLIIQLRSNINTKKTFNQFETFFYLQLIEAIIWRTENFFRDNKQIWKMNFNFLNLTN